MQRHFRGEGSRNFRMSAVCYIEEVSEMRLAGRMAFF